MASEHALAREHSHFLSLPSFKVKVVQEELYCFKKMIHRDRVSSKCGFMLTSHESTHIRDRPTLKSSEQFRTGSVIHESKNTFGYFNYAIKPCLKTCNKSCLKTSKKSCLYSSKTMKYDVNKQTGLNDINVSHKNVLTECMSGNVLGVGQKETHMSKLNATCIKMLPVRSRHALFYTSSCHTDVTDSHELISGCQLRHRDREPSRIPVKWLISKFRKSRKIRNQLKHTIRKSIPKFSQIHYIIQNVYNSSQNTQMKCIPDTYCPKKVENSSRTKCTQKCFKHYISEGILADVFYDYALDWSHDLKINHIYTSVNHLKNVCQSALSTDIETNPGPTFYIDPSKTISAPYSQGSLMIFGETAGQQCLAMCLCALIYYKRRSICSPLDLVQIMSIGNELYAKLSRSARQSFLMFT